ncbi:hypothetical protein [Nocardia iowensis]|uniref:Uncharacterized protein n=1 Tax=Nocardia iowensis TaxID=204891 RepID=A0ABX8S042_NOCIO|nr:hypothetical protein [Nocardia iowensis]QXN94761.1 hypothetical protein KV110_17950 [Nocardia iowensis]
MAETITRDEFELAEHLGAAGPTTVLGEDTMTRWRAQDPDWHGKHWTYTDPDANGVRHLRPINVAPRPKSSP